MQTSTQKYGVEPTDAPGDSLPVLRGDDAPQSASIFEVDAQFKTARQFQRNVAKAVEQCKSLMADPALAAMMVYRLERGGEIIEGPSSRLAELVAYAWGNVIRGGNILEVGRDYVVAEGVAVDLERNNRVRVSVRKPIVDKTGRRFSESLIELVGRSAQSIAMRNALFQIVPGAYVRALMEHAKRVAAGAGTETPDSKRERALGAFAALGVSEREILSFLGRKAVDSIDASDLSRLGGAYTAIKDGDTTADEIFRAEKRRTKQVRAEAATSAAAPDHLQPRESPARDEGGAPSPDGRASEPPPSEASREDELARLRERNRGTVDAIARQVNNPPDAVWDLILSVFGGDLNGLVALFDAPATIVAACFQDRDPAAALREVGRAAATRKAGAKK